ncbi:hypothetical protein SVIOM74S_07919 [Streptomyces violarus]
MVDQLPWHRRVLVQERLEVTQLGQAALVHHATRVPGAPPVNRHRW